MGELTPLSEKRLIGVSEILIEIIRQSIINSPYRFQIAWMGGKRNESQQRKLWLNGKSLKDGINKLSKHQLGLAFDIVCYDSNDKITWSPEVFKEVADWIIFVAKSVFNVTITWGGNWKTFRDLPHFEISKINK